MVEKNGLDEDPSKTLIYLGPSLPLARAKEFLPDATYRPPAKQADITSDLVNLNPTRILLIDGVFRESLSVWAKEIVFALQYPGLKGIYGAASMGALRAAEMDHLGMIGVGRIYEWYRDGVTEDDSEVAVQFAINKDSYHLYSVPLVDIRAGVERYEREIVGLPVAARAREFLEEMRHVYYRDRTVKLCEMAWDNAFDLPFPCFPQKAADAEELLANFHKYESKAEQVPDPDHLSLFFRALYERDRRIRIRGYEVPQQHIDAHVLLFNPEYERIAWDSSNQELALMLCNCLAVTVSIDEITRESNRFQQRSGITTPEAFAALLDNNGWTKHEYDRLMIQNARIRKLQHSQTVSKAYRRNSQAILDYLRTHQAFDYWANEAVQLEKLIQSKGADESLNILLETPVFGLLAEHCEKEGLELHSAPEEYLLETGFSTLSELGVALARIRAGKEENG